MQLKKDKLGFFILLTIIVILLITGVVLVVLGTPNYKQFIQKSTNFETISTFVYGIVCLVSMLLLTIFAGLIYNSNRLMKQKTNE
ncbi:hypothetical protein [Mycoplasma sp. 'Moose RK']|uniref:hypothetical protein n=1 Tax=Mycoplasma sp. 'Moose RK' TaxID=2780095 RepID=UPI0018C25150|nr:hypothetical protein [Mycoplasma sp. 'Moose RK']MBG0730850.1 hypothetical protein [Mycoplasma sp. 'Moose RK']